MFLCLLQQKSSRDQTTHSALCYTLEPRFSEKGSQESLRGSAEAADLLPEHSAGSRELQRAALGICWETVKTLGMCVRVCLCAVSSLCSNIHKLANIGS